MWGPVLAKLERLRAVDRQCQAFGASKHGYTLRPPASAGEIRAAEERLGVALPPVLRSYYAEVANGGAGPHYGLLSARELEGLRPTVPYPGADALRRLDPGAGELPSNPEYFEAPEEAITGLIAVIEQGCGHRTCLVATAAAAGLPVGGVVDVSCDGYVVDTNLTLPDLYHQWLDGELAVFAAVREAMAAGATFAQIQEDLKTRFGRHDAGDRVASIADVRKPESLFGPGGNTTFHGATQFPWYEKVLRAWQAKNRGAAST